MRNITSITTLLATLLIAVPASAATISLLPTTVSVTKGQTFTVAVAVDPGSTNAYTVKSAVSYPAALVEATSFSFDSGWIPLSMSGYDSVDNTGGTLVKTAGFPKGFSSAKTFGTISFRAKESGTATISVGSASLAYDASSKNTLSGPQGASTATITTTATPPPTASTTSPAAPPGRTPQTQTTPKPATTPKTTAVSGQVAGSAAATTSATTTQASAPGSTSTGAQAAAASGGFFGSYGWLLAGLAALALALGGAWWFVKRR